MWAYGFLVSSAVNFANSFDPDQAQNFVSLVWIYKLFDTLMVLTVTRILEKDEFEKKKKNQQIANHMKNYPAFKDLNLLTVR